MKILGINVTTSPKSEIVRRIETAILYKQKTVIFTPNPEMINFASNSNFSIINEGKSISFSEIINNADIQLPDGIGLKIACNFKSHFSLFNSKLKTSNSKLSIVHGVDFMLELCQIAEKQGWSIGLLGGMSQSAIKTKEKLLQKFPSLKIEYVFGDFILQPSFSNKNGQFESFSVISDHDAKPEITIPTPKNHLDILFVSLGTPKEQIWIIKNKQTFPTTVFMEVGGSFDMISNRTPRAPQLIQKLGFEWLWRLMLEPKRLTRQIRLFQFLIRVIFSKNSIQE